MPQSGAWRVTWRPPKRMKDSPAIFIKRWSERFDFYAMKLAKKYLKRVWALLRMGRKNAIAEQKHNSAHIPLYGELYQALIFETSIWLNLSHRSILNADMPCSL